MSNELVIPAGFQLHVTTWANGRNVETISGLTKEQVKMWMKTLKLRHSTAEFEVYMIPQACPNVTTGFEKEDSVSGVELICDSHHGQYIPQIMGERLASIPEWDTSSLSSEDLEALKAGPEDEWYWEAWTKMLDNVTYTDTIGNTWHLHQDGDLFTYCTELMSEEEQQEFFGE